MLTVGIHIVLVRCYMFINMITNICTCIHAGIHTHTHKYFCAYAQACIHTHTHIQACRFQDFTLPHLSSSDILFPGLHLAIPNNWVRGAICTVSFLKIISYSLVLYYCCPQWNRGGDRYLIALAWFWRRWVNDASCIRFGIYTITVIGQMVAL